jgi:hypothetical protein
MFRKSTILALAAVASLGAFALSSSSASAFGHFGGFGGGHFIGGGHGPMIGHGPMQMAHKPWPTFNPHWHWHWRHFGWRHPIWIAPVVAGGVATYAAAPAAPTYNRCTCLTKDYTPQGAVVFKDVCTNESAMNPPVSGPVTGDIAPQQPATVGYAEQPQQQGYLQPQAR